MSEALSQSEDLWSSYSTLKKIVWRHLGEGSREVPSSELINILRKHKQNFFSLLQNQPKNAKSREELKKGMVDGILIKGLGHQILSKELYQETIILSDMYDMNEFVALDLLCTAQIEMSYYPGLTRGLVAVLLYYEGRKSLVQCLRYLVQARNGVQWSLGARPDVVSFVTSYTDQLMDGGLFNQIFDLLNTLDLTKEIDKLRQNLAIGGSRHRRQVVDLFQEIRVILADIVFTWACQSGLPKAPTLSLINYLSHVQLEGEASGKIDDVSLYLVMALLSALDLSVLHSREDGEELVQSLPILSDPEYISAVCHDLEATESKWKNEGLHALTAFGLAVCIASLSIVPEKSHFQSVLNKQDAFIDMAIKKNVFEFMHNIILENETLYKEEYLFKRVHHLLTDFIVYMYATVKQLKNKAEDLARTVQMYAREGLDAPANLPRYFEYLLLTIAKFYKKDVLGTGLVLCYWNPTHLTTSYNPNRISIRTSALSRFIQIGTDMPPTLFIPYITMLSGLSTSPQAARYCFNMLKPPELQFQTSNTLTWNHFFTSFTNYYNSLRQEPPVSDTVYRNVYFRGVSPHELEGLYSVLLLIRTIGDHDKFSRLALCEHPTWAPLSILLGLIRCSIPIPFKANLLLTLASLSKSPENAAQMWENLETSQILVTVPTTSSYAPRGIQTELDEIESRLEEYQMTKAFLKLVDVLSDFGIPTTLGASARMPGFDPYFSFILNSVFLKFHTRSYQNASEKWEVANLCLKLFDKFLSTYEPQISDFTQKDFQPPPGFHLMIQMGSKSELLNVVLQIVDEGMKLFDEYVTVPGQKLIEECTLYCLNIIHSVLGLQTKFFNVLSASKVSYVLTSLSKLLLTINPKTGQPDHCLNIAKYISYQPYLVKHAYVVVKILDHVTSTPLSHGQFNSIYLSSDATYKIRHGFVLSLDSEIDEDDSALSVKTNLEILKLIKNCLAYTAPNFSQFLLGFDIKRDITRTEFRYPGVSDFPRSGLHSIISLMDRAVDKESQGASSLLEASYEVIFMLASSSRTYGPVLRFLRMNNTFFTNHLSLCQKRLSGGLQTLKQLSWLLKILAVELKVCGHSKQLVYLKQLSHFLVKLPQIEGRTNQEPFSLTDSTENFKTMVEISDNFLNSLISHFEYNVETIQTPEWQFFDGKVLNVLLENCLQRDTKMIDVKKLHQRIYHELKHLSGPTAMGQMQAISQEIRKVLNYALEFNQNKEKYASVVQFVDAWRQVVEVITLYMPREVLSLEESQLVSIHFAFNLLKQLKKTELPSEVGQLLSGVVLLSINNLRKCHRYENKLLKFSGEGQPPSNVLQLQLDKLKDVLESIIEWIMVVNVTDEKLKINLYAALMTLLDLTSLGKSTEGASLSDSMYVSRLDSSKVSVETHLQNLKTTTDCLAKYGDRLVEIVCQDCIGGYDVSRMLGFCSFSVLTTLSGNINWILYMSGRGYLKFIIQSILDSNSDLERLLEPEQTSIKPLYVYQSKLLFLGRLAGTKVGAELLMEEKFFSCFSNMNVFRYHPDISKRSRLADVLETFIPPPEELYLQMWLPTLEICNAILTTLTTDNRSAIVQIMYFLFSHLDVVENILRSGSPSLSKVFLKELAILTSVIARTASNDLMNVLENPGIVHDQRAHLYKIQKLTLALLPKFILSEDTVKELLNPAEYRHTYQSSERLLHAFQIMANLLCYARNVVSSNDVRHQGLGVLFLPTLQDTNQHSISLKNGPNSNEQAPPLGVLVQQLMAAVNYSQREKPTFDLLTQKVKEVPMMDSTEIDKYIDEALNFKDTNTKREYMFDLFSDRLEKKAKELKYCSFIIENSIYLIWIHLDYYMLRAIPKVKNFGSLTMNSSMASSTLASATEATWKVSTDDISNLKHGLVAILNDNFTHQLLHAIQDRSHLDREFVEVMLKKIIRLIQFVPVK